MLFLSNGILKDSFVLRKPFYCCSQILSRDRKANTIYSPPRLGSLSESRRGEEMQFRSSSNRRQLASPPSVQTTPSASTQKALHGEGRILSPFYFLTHGTHFLVGKREKAKWPQCKDEQVVRAGSPCITQCKVHYETGGRERGPPPTRGGHLLLSRITTNLRPSRAARPPSSRL